MGTRCVHVQRRCKFNPVDPDGVRVAADRVRRGRRVPAGWVCTVTLTRGIVCPIGFDQAEDEWTEYTACHEERHEDRNVGHDVEAWKPRNTECKGSCPGAVPQTVASSQRNAANRRRNQRFLMPLNPQGISTKDSDPDSGRDKPRPRHLDRVQEKPGRSTRTPPRRLKTERVVSVPVKAPGASLLIGEDLASPACHTPSPPA